MSKWECSRRWYVSKGKAHQERTRRRLRRLGLCINCWHRKGKPYCKKCAEQINTRRRKAYHKAGRGMTVRNRFLYGADAAEHMKSQLKKQKGRCAICRKKLLKPFQDHDRKCCKSVKTCGRCKRGALCVTCNTFLGKVEQKRWLKSALQYLKEWSR
jgi:hypothetical protein